MIHVFGVFLHLKQTYVKLKFVLYIQYIMRQNVTPDESNHIKDILSSDQEKKLLKSLQSIPSNAREDHAMLEKLVKKLG